MNDLDVVPPHLAGLPVFYVSAGTRLSVRATEMTTVWEGQVPQTPIEQIWQVMTPQERHDLYQISLVITSNLEESHHMATRIGGYVLYEDNEIRWDNNPRFAEVLRERP